MHKVNITYPNGEIRIRYFNPPPILNNYFSDREPGFSSKWAEFEFVELSEDGSVGVVEQLANLCKIQRVNHITWHVSKSGLFVNGSIND